MEKGGSEKTNRSILLDSWPEMCIVEDNWCLVTFYLNSHWPELFRVNHCSKALPKHFSQFSSNIQPPSHVWSLQSYISPLWRPSLVCASIAPIQSSSLTDCSPRRKIPWRLSNPQKRRQRKRLRLVDNVVATVDAALKRQSMESGRNLIRWKEEMPTEQEMRPKDKYTMFDRKEKKYRKGIHSKLSRSPLLRLRCWWGARASEVDDCQS